MKKFLWYGFLGLFSFGFLSVITAIGAVAYIFSYYAQGLPDHTYLKNYEPPIVTRLYAGDGRLMAEFAQERRAFVPIDAIPERVRDAFIAAEDQNFYRHKGVDPVAIGRAAVLNFLHVGGSRLKGASTITQQVAKNFLLTNEVSYERKIKEAILAYRIEQAMGKNRILELYLNQIYLGEHAYGVAAAALQYFNKSLDELSVAEMAYLAALPKAPNNYNPARNYEGALARRNYVIGRMREDGYITREEENAAIAAPLEMTRRDPSATVNAPFFAEEVRRELASRYGTDSLYKGGLAARTTLDPKLQDIALRALREGLQRYDRRHGYRGPFGHFDTMGDWKTGLAAIVRPVEMPDDWKLAAVLGVNKDDANLGFADGSKGTLKLENLKWAKKYLDDGYSQGPEIKVATDVLREGDVVMVQPTEGAPDDYALRQIPLIQGAAVAIDPHTGRVLAMQGGWKYRYGSSEYNRATQARRQPGSAFKPFIYAAALEHGFTPASVIMDGPFAIQDRPGHIWSPVNYKGEYGGPTTLRVALEKSKNLVTVRIAHKIGMDVVKDYAERFGIVDDMPLHLSGALGSIETTLLRLTTAYATFVNGGKKVAPSIIDRVQDGQGKTVFRHDDRACEACGPLVRWEGQAAPDVPDTRPQILDPRVAYQMVHILEGVVERGTATALKELGRPIAGKTGTTNESRDVWFIGLSPDLIVGVFVGFDEPRSLGKRETGGVVAAPVVKDFLKDALADVPPAPFRVPPGIKNIRVNAKTGRLAEFGDEDVIWEAFIPGTEPTEDSPQPPVLDADGSPESPAAAALPDAGAVPAGSYSEDDAADAPPSNAGASSPGPYGISEPTPYAPPYAPSAPVPGSMPALPPPPQPEGTPANGVGSGTGGLY